MPIIMFSNLKGGVAKTTNAVAVAECLAWRGHKTLVIDADHQCTASELLMGKARFELCDNKVTTLHDLLNSMMHEDIDPPRYENYIIEGVSDIAGGLENLSVLPSSLRIDEFNRNYERARAGLGDSDDFRRSVYRQRDKLRRWLLANFEFTIIDCPPSVAAQVRLLFPAADTYVIPCLPDYLSIRGAQWLLERVRRIGTGTKPLGLLWSMYREVANHRRYMEQIERGTTAFGELPKPFKTRIPNSAAISAAMETGNKPTTFHNKYESRFANLYIKLCDEIMTRCNGMAKPRESK